MVFGRCWSFIVKIPPTGFKIHFKNPQQVLMYFTCWVRNFPIRKDKYCGRKYYVEYEDEDELLHQEDDEEERYEDMDVTLLKVNSNIVQKL